MPRARVRGVGVASDMSRASGVVDGLASVRRASERASEVRPACLFAISPDSRPAIFDTRASACVGAAAWSGCPRAQAKPTTRVFRVARVRFVARVVTSDHFRSP